MTSYTATTINRQWSEFNGLMTAARCALRKHTRQNVDDQDACDVIGIAFTGYQKHFSNGPPKHPNATIRIALRYAARTLLRMKCAQKRNHYEQLEFDFSYQETEFNPDRLDDSLSSLPDKLRETAYAIVTFSSHSEAAHSLGITTTSLHRRLKKMRDQDTILNLCS